MCIWGSSFYFINFHSILFTLIEFTAFFSPQNTLDPHPLYFSSLEHRPVSYACQLF